MELCQGGRRRESAHESLLHGLGARTDLAREQRIVFGEEKIAQEEDKLRAMEEELKKHQVRPLLRPCRCRGLTRNFCLQEDLASRETNISDLTSAEQEARNEIAEKQPRLDELKELLKADKDRATKWKVRRRWRPSRSLSPARA